ncbi:T9SS type A sorting domain-containing protein [Saprospiraceae bacterium]|nr:T9SS type A sorting domain-containing protein [Saprospiraceae bacterium]
MKNLIILILMIFSIQSSIGQTISYGEYFIDHVGAFGTGIAIDIDDEGSVILDVNTLGLSEGPHYLFTHFIDEQNTWSQMQNKVFYVKHKKALSITKGEYFIDLVGAFGDGLELDITLGTENVLLDKNILDIEDGLHYVFYRFQDSNGTWSQTERSLFIVRHKKMLNITSGEYFIDTVGVYGSGLKFELDSIKPKVEIYNQLELASTLEPGFHVFFYRFQDSENKWSMTYSDSICTGQITGRFYSETKKVCAGDSILFDFEGEINNTTIFEWDLNQDGIYDDLTTSGGSFWYTPEPVDVGTVKSYVAKISSEECVGSYIFDTIQVEVLAPLLITDLILNDQVCFGACNGFIDFNIINAAPSISYAWSTGSNDSSIVDLCEGQYFLEAIDNNQCRLMDTFEIIELEELVIQLISTQDETNNDSNGEIEIDVMGGSGNYVFEWEKDGVFYSNDMNLTNLGMGTYLLTITDDVGCIDTLIVEIKMITGIHEQINSHILIYPNPAFSSINIEINKPGDDLISILVFDNQGRVVLQSVELNPGIGPINISVESLPSGLYTVHLKSDQFFIAKKIAVQRN